MSTELVHNAATRIGDLADSNPGIIGLTGKMGSGKDTVLMRLQHLFGEANYRKASYAQTLKESTAALFNVTTEMLEAWKNEPSIRVAVLDTRGAGRDLGRSFSIREILQRNGTEAHRQIEGFGQDIWVEAAMRQVAAKKMADPDGRTVDVFTDVRFENEARAIVELGGLIYEVEGPEADADGLDGVAAREANHASEHGIPRDLIHGTIVNTTRPSFEVMAEGDPAKAKMALGASLASLDDEVARVHAELLEWAR